MKIRHLFLIAICAILSSCNSLELGPIDHYGLNNYWKTKEQCERFIIGLHYRMRSRMSATMTMGELRGGTLNTNAITSIGEGAYDIEIVGNTLSAANPGISNWADFYMDIYQINHAIDKISNNCDFLDDKTRKTWLGQLYGLRAWYYFHLLRTFGGVPLCDKPDVLITDNLDKLDKARASEQDTWEFIRNDVDKSCEMYSELGYTNYKSMNCYWNKGASQCLKAEVYLWGAKVKPIESSSVYTATVQKDLEDARDALLDAEPNYAPNKNFTDAFSVKNKDANKETILAARYLLGEETNHFSNFTYNVSTFTKYFDETGKKLGNVLNIGAGALRYEYSLDFWKSFDASDARRNATFLQFYLKDNDDNLYPAGRSLKKFLGDLSNGKIQFTNDIPLYRYMDIALLLAEIYNELGDKAETVKWINKVRSRAGVGPYSYTNKEEAEEVILKERTFEFVGEGKRWYDVRRMLDGKYALDLVDGNELKLVWPIDAGVLSKDNKVKQNKGYL